MKLKKCTLIVSLILLAALLYQNTVLSQPLTLTPLLGAYGFEGNRNISKSMIAGLGVDFFLSEKISAEFMYLRGDFDINYYDFDSQSCVTHDGIDANIVHIGGQYRLFKYKNWSPYVAAGVGLFYMDTDYADMFRDHQDRHYQYQLNYGAGLKYFISDEIAIRWDIRHMLSPEHMDNDISAVIGISYSFDFAQKISEPKVQTEYLSSHLEKKSSNQGYTTQKSNQQKSETAAIDTDNDGILDAQDICPKTNPAIEVDESGCPKDTDKDGVFDGIDRCPETPSNITVNIFGCPPDQDRDGVMDAKDQCADTPFKVPVDVNGCPRDRDRDGVSDSFDLCPQTPFGKLVDANGCPVLMKTLKTYRMKIEFDYKSTEVRSIYHTDLEKAARSMIIYQKAFAMIESHTDNIGSDAYNINLSNQRAESVKHYLNKNFHIPIERMKTFGFGESKPIADNDTESGRQKNRRVEIMISEKM
ncbi:MAG: OmpA family protein [Candidatus Magnetomorum sp.]|nr:OmpA family protein [Candidatus Magnetomorum sp.]